MQRGEKIVCEKCGKKIQIVTFSKIQINHKSRPVKLFDFKKIGQNIQANMKKNADQAKNFFQGLAPKNSEPSQPNSSPARLPVQNTVRAQDPQFKILLLLPPPIETNERTCGHRRIFCRQ